MTQCFKEHPNDDLRLNHNSTPVADCECKEVRLYGSKTLVTDVPILTCSCLWRTYQREAEKIVAPDGVLIVDPVERNRAINAAYARLWLHDRRFQWAGLAAFASKQVGCGLLHAADSIDLIRDEYEARQRLRDSRRESGILTPDRMTEQAGALRDYKEADARNPVPSVDFRSAEEDLSLVQQQFRHVYDMMALGNTTLFLDIFPLHEFYAKRGLKELQQCLDARGEIYGHPKFPVLWPVGQEKLQFGVDYPEVLPAFEAIEAGDIARSVEYLALHEQKNILQPTIYQDRQLTALLRGNHVSYVTGFPSGVAQAIELTLTSQCQRVADGRTIGFGSNPLADLSEINQRMEFVLQAAARFDQMLNDHNRNALEQSINEIVSSGSRL
ncbi:MULTISPECIES: DUF2515 family protein [Gammaproteobacteria]|uniref:DUF2515 family protein n=1 Tax=Gammaproteobacteria TaxID=1236 RepID=UPI001912CFEC|nr:MULTISPECIES: hypothetical protein [Gammaproteobacteria]MBK5304718.1 hypothetical protein [Bacillus sp. TH86]MBK5324487.1 hypothetical protein [Bacillus sp. TH59]MBK5339437.1 hypothetical protein [Bacillus sp. TH57]MBK5313484.1 hypothetical protein [Pseudomonas sp. TH71]MBK5318983.1 hypothetical protein [Erwinia sp. TH79]